MYKISWCDWHASSFWEIIGEVANHVTKETQQKFPDIEWRQIIGTRNVFIHEYYDVNRLIVYNIVRTELPLLEEKVQRILDTMIER